MARESYKQFCPVAMAAEVLCNRWTMVVLRELVLGSRRFNELRRGLPRMSPALLAKRLKELEGAGIVRRVASPSESGVFEYHLTRSGRDLKPVLQSIGTWGQRWIEEKPSLKNLDARLLMWFLRRAVDTSCMPKRRLVIEFLYPELPAKSRSYWLIVAPDCDVDLCLIDAGFDVDLYVTADLRAMTAIWMGTATFRAALADQRVMLTGDRELASRIQTWLGLSHFAGEKKLARA